MKLHWNQLIHMTAQVLHAVNFVLQHTAMKERDRASMHAISLVCFHLPHLLQGILRLAGIALPGASGGSVVRCTL